MIGVSRGDGIDVTAPDAAERIAALAGGPVDILVNNAGTSFARPLDELTDDEWNGQWELHVMASMRLMRAFAPGMAERGWGRIVNVSSSAGKRPSLTNAAYAVTKAAQLSLSRVFADAYAAQGRARQRGRARRRGQLAVDGRRRPGRPDRRRARASRREEALAAQAAKIPLGRLATEDEIASVVAFLCSERASTVTGAAWSADGGTVATIVCS